MAIPDVLGIYSWVFVQEWTLEVCRGSYVAWGTEVGLVIFKASVYPAPEILFSIFSSWGATDQTQGLTVLSFCVSHFWMLFESQVLRTRLHMLILHIFCTVHGSVNLPYLWAGTAKSSCTTPRGAVPILVWVNGALWSHVSTASKALRGDFDLFSF